MTEIPTFTHGSAIMRRYFQPVFLTALVAAGFQITTSTPAATPCRIEVLDKQTHWPVPLVQLRTTDDIVLVSDNAGVIAVDQPDLLNREIWFEIIGHGYNVPKDGFGFHGKRLTCKPGETIPLEVERTNIAKRLGRLTGGGQFAESQKFGDFRDWREPNVFGCDTVQCAQYRGKCYWLWGDTDLPTYALGIFDSSGATTAARPIKSLQPPLQVEYDYFTDAKGRPRGVCPMPGKGPTWVGGYVVLPDRDGRERLVGTYSKIRQPMEVYETGLCAWNDEKDVFELVHKVWNKSDKSPKRPLVPNGHPAFWTEEHGQRWLLFGNPFPNFRCPATFEAWQDEKTWQELTPPKSLKSADGKEDVAPTSGSIAWNGYRKRWVTVFEQIFGKPSAFGELWYAEADAPTGPWGPAVKVLTHDNYTFYNPRLHQEFTDAASPVLLFEGTYTSTFADHPQRTPRFDYNQILYRLDLNDPALKPAQ
jgi:hypothetical protein